ncbi:hypothetical protein ACLBYG_22215 [Methylobacterium sp. D53M]
MSAEAVIAHGDAEIRVASDPSARSVLIMADDGAAETCVEMTAGRVRALIGALGDALRDLED